MNAITKKTLSLAGGILMLYTTAAIAELPEVATLNPIGYGNFDELEQIDRNQGERVIEATTMVTGKVKADNFELLTRIEELQQEVQQLRGQLEVQEHELNRLGKRQRELYVDLDRRISSAAYGGATSNAAANYSDYSNNINIGGSDSKSSPEDIAKESESYSKAYNMLKNKNYSGAKQQFQQLIKEHPNGTYTANAHYWLGELYLLDGSRTQAVSEFNKVVGQFPKHHKAADSYLKLGVLDFEQGNLSSAKSYFNKIITEFPNTASAQVAKKQLQRIENVGA